VTWVTLLLLRLPWQGVSLLLSALLWETWGSLPLLLLLVLLLCLLLFVLWLCQGSSW
jgi:hypothetical protein